MSTSCPLRPRQFPPLLPADVLAWDGALLRIYSAAGPHGTVWSQLRTWGPVASMRFDHHPPPPREHPVRAVGHLVAASTTARPCDPLEVAVLERFQTGVIDRHTDEPRLVLWQPTRPLGLLQLTDATWLARAGGNAALLAGARGRARLWSRALYRAYPEIDGLIWASSVLPPGRAVLLDERAADAVPTAPLSDRALREPALQPALARIAATYGMVLL